METLDFQVAQALLRWRLVERALHGHGVWLMTYHDISVPVIRFIREGRVSLVGHFPALCVLDEPDLTITLSYEGEVLRVLPLAQPLDEDGCEVWAAMMVGTPVPTG